MRGSRGNADAERANLSAGRRVELDRAADRGCGRVSVGPQCEGIVPVRGQADHVGYYLRAVIANYHQDVHLSRGYCVHRDASGRAVGIVESDYVTDGVAAL
jgi:hypothetical protein